jgi:hypothetical protein
MIIEGAYGFIYRENRSQIITTMQVAGIIDLFLCLLMVVALSIAGNTCPLIIVRAIIDWAVATMLIGALLVLASMAASMLTPTLLCIKNIFRFCRYKIPSPR